MNNSLIIGKRIPIGAAVGGCVTFCGEIFNILYPDLALSVSAVGGLSVALVALTQIFVVNKYGVSQPPKN
jgi:hypothetical protein